MEKNNTKQFIAGIVTYNPNLIRLKSNIESVISNESIERIILVDNHSKNIQNIRELIGNYSQIQLVCQPVNLGIANALNLICKKAVNLGYLWVVTLDQDSQLAPQAIDTFQPYTLQDTIGIICPRIEDLNMGTLYSTAKSGHEDIKLCITSGNLVNLKAWQAIGGYTEELFIDGVDFDFCIKLRNAGYRIIRIYDTYLLQEIGYGKRSKICGHCVSIMNHPPLRLYYITRNYLYIGKKYHQMRYWATEVAKRIIIILVYEKKRREKIKFILQGVHDFLYHKMGSKTSKKQMQTTL